MQDGGAGPVAQLGEARPADHAEHRAGARLALAVGAAGARAGGCLGEVGDPDPVRTAGLDPGLDGGARVVDVHVDAPEPVAAADHQRVAETGEGAAQGGQGPVGGVQQVDHLERGVAGAGRPDVALAVVGGPERAGRRQWPAQRDRPHRLVAGHRVGERAEDGDQAPAAGVHHARLGEHVELVGGLQQRAPGGLVGGVGDRREPAGHRGGLPGGGGRHREERPLDRLGDGLVGGFGGAQQGGAQLVGTAARGGQGLGGAAQPLGQDDAGVAAGADQRAPGHRADGMAEVRAVAVLRFGEAALDGGGGGLDGQVEVGAGVAVRYGVDVECVDLLAGLAERAQGQPAPGPHGRGVERVQHQVSSEWDAAQDGGNAAGGAGRCWQVIGGHPGSWLAGALVGRTPGRPGTDRVRGKPSGRGNFVERKQALYAASVAWNGPGSPLVPVRSTRVARWFSGVFERK